MQRRQILWAGLAEAAVADMLLDRCVLRAVGLARATIADTTFSQCQFTDVGFEEAHLSRVTFRGCRLAHCRFSGAVLESVRFEDCEVRGCAFGEAAGQDLAFFRSELAECDFFAATLAGLTLDTCRLRAVSLVRAVPHALRARGPLFSDCLFEMAAFAQAAFPGTRTEGCYFAGARFSGPTDEPDILGAMAKDDALALADAVLSPPLPRALATGAGPRLLAACCDAALFARDVERRRLAMLAGNKRRLAWARRRPRRGGRGLPGHAAGARGACRWCARRRPCRAGPGRPCHRGLPSPGHGPGPGTPFRPPAFRPAARPPGGHPRGGPLHLGSVGTVAQGAGFGPERLGVPAWAGARPAIRTWRPSRPSSKS